jgi:multiple sugar transport system ATP-binding protein
MPYHPGRSQAAGEREEGLDVSEIRLEQVVKEFAGGVRAVDGVSLSIESGEFMVLVGPSGCGKSTLLRMVAGLEEVSEGEIWIGDREVSRLAPRDRDVAMVFQNYALYPHLSVEKNLAYGLKVRKTPKAEIARRVDEVARMLGLEELRDRRPAALSGGQRQRVAMGRAIVREPVAFLMDEPLSNLDAKLRVDMRAELARLHDRLGVTTIYVTHDQVEAMTLGMRVAVMRDGTIQQVDTPQALYRNPVNLFVAAFIGSPSMNLVEAELSDDAVEFAGFRVPLTSDRRPAGLGSGTVILGVRAQDFEDARTAEPELPVLEVEAVVVEELGSATHVLFTIDAPPVDVDAVRAASDEGETATLLATDRRTLFTAEVAEGTAVRQGQRIRLALDPARLHFFDPESSETLRPHALAPTATG